MVHKRGSGKTMAYLPPICSFVLNEKKRYSELPKGSSPIVIILCRGVQKAEEVYDLLEVFFIKSGKYCGVNLLIPPVEKTKLVIFPSYIKL